ncbi:MAG TPA: sigma-70 family RNA polymerase sigma factor [Actinomycetota bacterium]
MDRDRTEGELDSELHRRLSMGEQDAFEELYRRYAPAAFGLAYRVTAHELLAQEVVHDAFMALWKAPQAFDPSRGAFRSFFLSLVHHRAVDVVRREQRMRQRAERMNPEPLEDEDVAEGVVQEAWLADRREEVLTALGKLPPEQREVLELAYFRGYTQAQVAEAMQIPLGTVKTRTLAALRKLRAMLGGGDA